MLLRAVIWLAVSTQAQTADDKISLPEQESAARELATREGWTIVDVLSVPGYSRRESDVITALEDFAEQGIFAYHSLRQHWANRDFDILIARDHSRFGRSQTLHAYVVENTIVSGARIYLLQGGWIDQTTMRVQTALGGFSATGDIDRLVKARKSAMDSRARHGLPVSSKILSSHRLERDLVTGKAIRLVVDESRTPLWEEAARLIIAGVSYADLGGKLHEKGFVTPSGQPYSRAGVRNVITNPGFWGHMVAKIPKVGHPAEHFGPWVFGPGHPIPDGVIIYYNTHPPALDGPLAEQLQAELLRRNHRTNRGAYKTYWFSGLFLCAECGYTMASNSLGRYIRCAGRYCADHVRPYCPGGKPVSAKYARAWLDHRLRLALAAQDPSALTPSVSSDLPARLSAAAARVADLENKVRRLIILQSEADDSLASIYADRIANLANQLKSATAQSAALQIEAETVASKHQHVAYEELARLTIDALWAKPPLQINQLLLRLFGNWRIVAGKDGQIVGMAPARSRYHSK